MANSLALVAALWLLAAGIFGLVGTNAQAAMAKSRLLADPDPRVATAGALWRPPIRFSRTAQHRERQVALNALKLDPAAWARYRDLERELSAWNWIESAVALTSGAAFMGLWAVAIVAFNSR